MFQSLVLTLRGGEDEEMADAPELPPTEEPELAETLQSEEAPKAEPEEEVSAPKGRRRGRRQVMKKITTKDEEGYLGTYQFVYFSFFCLPRPHPPTKTQDKPAAHNPVIFQNFTVTQEEPVWESFSEDEAPPPVKRKPAVSVNPKPANNKGSQKTGQGNIMSFFGKK